LAQSILDASVVDLELKLETERRIAECHFRAAMYYRIPYHEVCAAFQRLCQLGFSHPYWKRYWHLLFATYCYSLQRFQDCIVLLEPIMVEVQQELDEGNESVRGELYEINELLRKAGWQPSKQESTQHLVQQESQDGGAIQRFHHHDPATQRQIEIQIFDPVLTDHRWNDYRETRLLFEDGRRYYAIFWRDPRERGGHWWEEPGMVIVQDLTTDQILAAVEEILQRGAVKDAFEPMANVSPA
jgi:hypothetical protein